MFKLGSRGVKSGPFFLQNVPKAFNLPFMLSLLLISGMSHYHGARWWDIIKNRQKTSFWILFWVRLVNVARYSDINAVLGLNLIFCRIKQLFQPYFVFAPWWDIFKKSCRYGIF